MLLPKLYAKASTGKVKCWRIEVDRNNIITHHGYIDSKIQTNSKPVHGKNVGRSNETTPHEQACLEAKGKWQQKIDKGYVEDMSGESDVRLPMLAQPFKKSKHHIKYPAFVQPKLNGVRCFAERSGNDIDYTSRKGKSFNGTLRHLTPDLLHAMKDGEIFDGEIYMHGWTFQQIIRAVKKLRPESARLQYWVYDIADDTMPFTERIKRVHILNHGLRIVPVFTQTIQTERDVKVKHDFYIQNGYEGAIIRNSKGGYTFNHRSKDLQKYKEFFDDEFVIIGGKEGTGTEDGCVVFQVEKNGKTFWVRPRGTQELRRNWFRDIDQLIGRELTVRYQEKSEDGIPIFPVGICIRDYE